MAVTTLDIQSIHPSARHPLVFAVFENMVPGASLVLVNNHDPVPLQRQFAQHFAGEFSWTYLEQGPTTWRVEVTRMDRDLDPHASGSCCGGCG